MDTRLLQLFEFRIARTLGGGKPHGAEGIKKNCSLVFGFFLHASKIIKRRHIHYQNPSISPPIVNRLPRKSEATMHLLSLLSLASLSLAAPHVKRQTCSSSTLQWTVTGFNTFTANPGPNGVSSISFDFVDQTSGTSSECGRSLPAGSGGSPADPNNFYSCANAAFQYKWDGTTLSLEETLQCGT